MYIKNIFSSDASIGLTTWCFIQWRRQGNTRSVLSYCCWSTRWQSGRQAKRSYQCQIRSRNIETLQLCQRLCSITAIHGSTVCILPQRFTSSSLTDASFWSSMSPSSRQRILNVMGAFRPAFRDVAQALTDVDLILVEEAFERLLLVWVRRHSFVEWEGWIKDIDWVPV